MMENLFGGLLEFENQKKLDEFISSITKQDALKIIELGILYAQKNGIFGLEESAIIYKSFSKIKDEL